MATAKDPTDLLWAYALKREHKHLLTRIQQIESANSSRETRIAAAEQAALSARGTDVAALTKQVQSMQNDTKNHARKLEDKVADALDTVGSASEAMSLKIEAMEKEGGAAKEEERKRGFAREKALLKRVGELEAGCQGLRGELEGLKEKAEDHGVAGLRTIVDGLEVAVEQQGGELEGGLKKMKEAEAKYLELEKVVEKYKREAAELATKAATRPVQAHAPAQAQRQDQLASARPASSTTDAPAMPVEQPRERPTIATTKKRQPHHKTTMQKEVEALLAANAATSSTQKKPTVRQGKGWLEVERTPSTDVPLVPAQLARQTRGGATQTQAIASKAASAPKSKKRKIEPDHEIDAQPVQTQRTTRSQIPKKPIVAPKPSPAGQAVPAHTQRQRKEPAPKAIGKQAAAPTKKPVKASARLLARELTPMIPESPAPNSVVLSQLSTVLSSAPSSPSPSHRSRKRQRKTESEVQVPASSPLSSPRPRRRHIQQKDDYETFLRKCKETNAEQ